MQNIYACQNKASTKLIGRGKGWIMLEMFTQMCLDYLNAKSAHNS